MNNTMRIKLGEVTNLSDARYAAAIGIEYIGFCFDPKSPAYIPPVKAKEIMDWITGSYFVGEFNNQSVSEIEDICSLLGIDAIELGNENTPSGYAVIRKLDLASTNEDEAVALFNEFVKTADAFHVYSTDVNYNPFNPFVLSLCAAYKIIWGFSVNPENIKLVKDEYRPYALNLTGGNEEKPGLKDFDQLEELLTAIGFFN